MAYRFTEKNRYNLRNRALGLRSVKESKRGEKRGLWVALKNKQNFRQQQLIDLACSRRSDSGSERLEQATIDSYCHLSY